MTAPKRRPISSDASVGPQFPPSVGNYLASPSSARDSLPTVRCNQLKASVDFYTKVLDFGRMDNDELADPAFVTLSRAGDTLFLSSHAGDGKVGQAIYQPVFGGIWRSDRRAA
jgi:hypothetical protein